MNVVAYLRFSTDNQDGATQHAEIEAWAAAEGHEIVAWHTDEGISGKEGVDVRIALGAALKAVVAGEAGGVVIQRLDRLARSLVIQEQLLAEFWRAGGQVFSVDPTENPLLAGDDPRDPTRPMIRQILGAVAEYERKMIRLRMMAGAARKHAQGGYAYGRPPYGFRAENFELVPVAEEQRVISEILRLRQGGLGLAAIAEFLNEGGVLRGGNRWHSESVRRVLSRARVVEHDRAG